MPGVIFGEESGLHYISSLWLSAARKHDYSEGVIFIIII